MREGWWCGFFIYLSRYVKSNERNISWGWWSGNQVVGVFRVGDRVLVRGKLLWYHDEVWEFLNNVLLLCLKNITLLQEIVWENKYTLIRAILSKFSRIKAIGYKENKGCYILEWRLKICSHFCCLIWGIFLIWGCFRYRHQIWNDKWSSLTIKRHIVDCLGNLLSGSKKKRVLTQYN